MMDSASHSQHAMPTTNLKALKISAVLILIYFVFKIEVALFISIAKIYTADAWAGIIFTFVLIYVAYSVIKEAIPGFGLECLVDGKKVTIGTLDLMKKEKVKISDEILKNKEKLENEGKTVMIVSYEKNISLIAVADELKKSSKEAIQELKKMGIKTLMITGDNERTAKAIAAKVGIEEVRAQVLPQDKEAKIRELQQNGDKVAMVGDGINDAPALAQADVGVALGSGTDVAIETGDIILMKDDLMDVVKAIKLSKKTFAKIRQNMFWAFVYNVIGIPIAAGILYPFFGILLRPEIAGAAMALSSVSVVTNSLVLKRFKV